MRALLLLLAFSFAAHAQSASLPSILSRSSIAAASSRETQTDLLQSQVNNATREYVQLYCDVCYPSKKSLERCKYVVKILVKRDYGISSKWWPVIAAEDWYLENNDLSSKDPEVGSIYCLGIHSLLFKEPWTADLGTEENILSSGITVELERELMSMDHSRKYEVDTHFDGEGKDWGYHWRDYFQSRGGSRLFEVAEHQSSNRISIRIVGSTTVRQALIQQAMKQFTNKARWRGVFNNGNALFQIRRKGDRVYVVVLFFDARFTQQFF